MTPNYPLNGAPGIHVFLLTTSDEVTTVALATVSHHKASAKWAALHEWGGRLEVQAWHGDHVRRLTCDVFGQWTVTP